MCSLPPLATCPADIGLASGSYYIDFTQQSTLPANWTLANDETVTYGPNGAEFTFAKRYDAPYIWTDFYILFGTVEVVMQAAPGTAIISSSVLISDDLDEVDWELSGNNFGATSGSVQTNYFGKGVTGNYDRGTKVATASPQTQFHTYTLDWTPNTLTWSIDGVVLRTLSNDGATSGAYQYPQSPMQLHLGLWDGGDADTAAGTVEWAGGFTDLTKVPYTMYVKSVKITNANPCASYSYSDMSGSASSINCGNSSAMASGSNLAPTIVNSNQVGGESTSLLLSISSSFAPASSSSFASNLSSITSFQPAAPSSSLSAFLSTDSVIVVPLSVSSFSATAPSTSTMEETVTLPGVTVTSVTSLATTATEDTDTNVSPPMVAPTPSLTSSSAETSAIGFSANTTCTAANSGDSSSAVNATDVIVTVTSSCTDTVSTATAVPASTGAYSNGTAPVASGYGSGSGSPTSNGYSSPALSSVSQATFTGAAKRLVPLQGLRAFFG